MSDINPLEGIDESELQNYSTGDILSSEFLLNLYDIEDLAERARIRALIIIQAKNLGVEKEVKDVLKAYDAADAKLGEDFANSQHNETDFSFEPGLNLKCGRWVADDRGVRQQKADGSVVYASRIPIVPVAIYRNADNDTEKIKLSFFKKSKRTIICDRKICASASKITDLAAYGLEVTSENAKLLVKYISDCVVNNIGELPEHEVIDQLGWHGAEFVPYAQSIIYAGEDDSEPLSSFVTTAGNYKAWCQCVSELRKNNLIRLTMAASFASVLIEKVSALPFVFHLWGSTGTGKTVALMAAASIWGNPAMGKMVRTMNMTQNSMLSTAAALNNLPFFGDELQTIKSRFENYDKLVMCVTEGIDRGRMKGNERQQARSWRCAFLFTGEEPCTQQSSGGGVKNRVIEVEVSGQLVNNGVDVVNILESNYGHAGHTFVKHTAEMSDTMLRQEFSKIFKALQAACKNSTTEKQLLSMALLLFADKLACECIYTDDVALTVDAVLPYLKSVAVVDAAERAYRSIVDFVSINSNNFWHEENNPVRGELWGRIDNKKDEFLINREKLVDILSNEGFSFDAVKKKWAESGYLLLNSQGKYYSLTSVQGIRGNFVRIRLPKQDENVRTSDNKDDEDYPIF